MLCSQVSGDLKIIYGEDKMYNVVDDSPKHAGVIELNSVECQKHLAMLLFWLILLSF